METILQTLASLARQRTEEAKKYRSPESMRRDAESMPKGTFPFLEAIAESKDIAFICECKKASPSKGIIAADFPYLQIARDYESAGASCISVLTEPYKFLGSDHYLSEIAAAVKIPCLRKDFTVDPYMIYQAKLLGASAVLLICAILEPAQLAEYHEIAESVGLTALVETHDEREIETAASIGARLIGVNNRNLHDFSVDTGHALDMIKYKPAGTLFVTESGIRNVADVQAARQAGADAVLIGETLMRAADKTAMLKTLRGLS